MRKVIIDRECPFYSPTMSILWFCEEHEKAYKRWQADQSPIKSYNAINLGIDIYKKAWNKKPFVDEVLQVKELDQEFGFGEGELV